MALLMRMVRRRRWDRGCHSSWLPQNQTPADPLGDFVTEDNALSVWLIEDVHGHLDRVLAGIAATRDHPAIIDYMLLDEKVLDDLAIAAERVPGGTPDDEANGRWHQHLVKLTSEKTAALVKNLWQQQCPTYRKSEQEVRSLLTQALASGHINGNKMKPDLLRRIQGPPHPPAG